MTLRAAGYRRTSGTQAFVFEPGFVLFNDARQHVCIYNQTASATWTLITAGQSPRQVATALHRHSDQSIETLSDQVDEIIRHWCAQGFLIGDSQPDQLLSTAKAEISSKTRSREVSWVGSWTSEIRGRRIRFAVEDATALDLIKAKLTSFDTDKTDANLVVEVRNIGVGEYAVIENGVEFLRTACLGLLLGAVHQTILRHVYPDQDWLALIHGGAVSRQGFGIALPAPSGSGKTTLIGYLIHKGFDYLGDDLVALSSPNGLLTPWPMPLNVKKGSWDTLSHLYPELSRSEEANVCFVSPPLDMWTHEPQPLKAFVFPTFELGASAELILLAPFDALIRLFADRIWLGYPLSAKRIERFIHFLKKSPAYSLRYGNLSEAASLLQGLVNERDHPP